MSTMEPPLDTLETSTISAAVEPSHEYHAEAHALSGYLHHPVYQRINEKATVALRDYRDDHKQENENRFTVEGIVSFESGRSRVSGNRNLKNRGWITLSTSIVEGLNVLEVITVDRVVSQVSTEHAYKNGHVPSVTFLGTQIVNLRLSGFLLEPKFDFRICADKPKGKTPYVKHLEFLRGVKKQVKIITDGDLPEEVRDEYSDRLTVVDNLIKSVRESGNGVDSGNGSRNDDPIVVTCSLVTSIDIDHIKDVIPGVKTAGNVLFIPEFGMVALGEVEVSSKRELGGDYDNYFNLKMLEMKLGCIGNGAITAGAAANNGTHHP
jgi:hypothetical protein